MAFEVFEGKGHRGYKGGMYPACSLVMGRLITMNRAAYEALTNGDDSVHVELLFDRESHTVGIRRTEPGPRTYPACVPKSKAYVVAAGAFIKFYGLPTVSTGRIDATMSDGILSFPAPREPNEREEKNECQ